MIRPMALAPCAAEAELGDPAITGKFAPQMAQIAAMDHRPPWCGYIGRRGGVPVGYGGFKGVPDGSGAVEIGYLTFPAYQGSGVATAIAAAMIVIARSAAATCVTAHTLPHDNPSTGVLRNNGFARDGDLIDPDQGTIWKWSLKL